MPDDFFISTRTPGSRTSTYGLADHLADPDPHHQYLFRTEFTESGNLTDGKLKLHNEDPYAHDGYLVKVSDLNSYVQINNFATELANHLYHDYTDPEGSGKAASIKAVHDAHVSLNTVISTHRTGYAQGSSTDHKDNTNQELYAHRVHTHSLTDLGAAAANHNHDDRYSLLSHNHNGVYAPILHSHNYLSESDLSVVGIYPHTVMGKSGEDGSGTIDPFDFNEEVTQGNVSISPTVMTSAVNKPDISTPGTTSFLNVVTEVTTVDTNDESSGSIIYGERYVSQTLTTDGGIYYRIGHRSSGTLAEGQDESTLWVWSDWQPVGGGSKDIFEVFYSTSTATPRGAFPLWTGETITNCKTLYPTFYQKALEYQTNGKIRVVTSTVYEQELTTYGECGAFVIDATSGSIRLPKITRFISSLDVIGDIGVTKQDQISKHKHAYSIFYLSGNADGATYGAVDYTQRAQETSGTTSLTNTVVGDEIQPKHIRLALYIQVFNTITPSATTDLEARVGVLESNAIMFARHDFTAVTGSSGWVQNSDGLYEYTFRTNHFTSSHIYMIESGGSVLVDESVEVHIVGETTAENVGRDIKLVAPQPFAGYIITLG